MGIERSTNLVQGQDWGDHFVLAQEGLLPQAFLIRLVLLMGLQQATEVFLVIGKHVHSGIF